MGVVCDLYKGFSSFPWLRQWIAVVIAEKMYFLSCVDWLVMFSSTCSFLVREHNEYTGTKDYSHGIYNIQSLQYLH